MIGNMLNSRNASHLLLVFFTFLVAVPAVEALDTGDALALLLGMFLTCIGFCACLGLYARKRSGEI